MLYCIARFFLFLLPPEWAHTVTLKMLACLVHLGYPWRTLPDKPITVMGIQFKNPIGLAAGLDKNADYIDALAALGFGFIEVGTVTPKPQRGNPKPRLFRLRKEKALLNRLGFNNLGVDHLIEKVKKRKSTIPLGINIGKNATTPLANAIDDYVYCFDRVYPYADYITANISSPNTEQLRTLQFGESLKTLLSILKARQTILAQQYKRYVPLVVKVSPDLTSEEINTIATIFLEMKIDGVIATNTTVNKSSLAKRYRDQQGGVSGKPLQSLADAVLLQFHERLQNHIPLIGVGGIFSKEDVQTKFSRGAALVQVYTGLIYQGPRWVQEVMTA